MQTPNPTPNPVLQFHFALDQAIDTLTALSGLLLVAQASRPLGLPQSVVCHLRLKPRQRGLDEAALVESFVLRNTVGGDSLGNCRHLSDDPGLPTLVDQAVPVTDTVRKFLYAWHGTRPSGPQKTQRPVGHVAFIPEETAPLQGLVSTHVDLVRAMAAMIQALPDAAWQPYTMAERGSRCALCAS